MSRGGGRAGGAPAASSTLVVHTAAFKAVLRRGTWRIAKPSPFAPVFTMPATAVPTLSAAALPLPAPRTATRQVAVATVLAL